MQYFPTLYTERLILRKIQVDDIPFLIKHGNNKKISDYVLNIPYPYREPDAAFRIKQATDVFKSNTRYLFAIVLETTGEFIGEISLHLDRNQTTAHLTYWVGELFRITYLDFLNI